MKASELNAPAALPPWESVPGTHWIGWMGCRAGVDTVDCIKISFSCRGQNLGHPARIPTELSVYVNIRTGFFKTTQVIGEESKFAVKTCDHYPFTESAADYRSGVQTKYCRKSSFCKKRKKESLKSKSCSPSWCSLITPSSKAWSMYRTAS